MSLDTKRSLLDIEIGLANKFEWKRNVVTFNICGWSGTLPIFHECDVLVMSKSGYLTEVEIKRSFVDFKNDFKKHRTPNSYNLIKNFWYCVPEGIHEKCFQYWKQNPLSFRINGFITYNEYQFDEWGPVFREHIVENPETLPVRKPVKLSIEQQFEVARLASMRVIGMKEKFRKLINNG